MDISNRCGPGLGYPKLQKLNHGYLLSVQSRYGISQKLKRYTYGVRTCIWFIHGIACDNQRYPWYISKHWYIPGISLVYAKTRKLINGYQIPDGKAFRSGGPDRLPLAPSHLCSSLVSLQVELAVTRRRRDQSRPGWDHSV